MVLCKLMQIQLIQKISRHVTIYETSGCINLWLIGAAKSKNISELLKNMFNFKKKAGKRRKATFKKEKHPKIY